MKLDIAKGVIRRDLLLVAPRMDLQDRSHSNRGTSDGMTGCRHNMAIRTEGSGRAAAAVISPAISDYFQEE